MTTPQVRDVGTSADSGTMFELTSDTLDRPFRDKHAAATAASIAGHVIILGSIVWAVAFTISEELPKVPTMMAFVAEAPAPPAPPPPPPPAAKAAQPSQRSTTAPPTGPTFIAPAEIPVGIQPEPGIDRGDEGGVVGGVEGGIPGGVLGGLLGGLVTEVLPPPAALPPRPRRLGGDIKEPALIHRVEPDYPGVAVSAKVAGTVILEATVDEKGAVTDVRVLRSIPLLDRAAIKAVQQWRYEPLVLNGVPAPFILTVTVTFSFR
jgi:protein TonB